jgi:fucose permease
LGSFFAGRLYDRYPGHKIMAGLLFLIGLTAVFIPLSPVVYLMVLLIFLAGIGVGGSDVGGNTLVLWRFKDRSGPYLNALYFFAGVGGIAAPLLLEYFLSRDLSFEWAYWFFAVLVLPIAIWLLIKPSPNIPTAGEFEGRSEADYRLVIFFGILFFIYVGIDVSFVGWVYSYVLVTEVGSSSQAAILTSAYWFAITAGRLGMIFAAAHIHPRPIIWGSMCGAVVSLGFFLLFPGSLSAAAVGTVGLGLSTAALLPMSLAYAERSMPIRGKITGVLWVFGSSGSIITPWLAGNLMGWINPIALVLLLLLYAVIGLLIFFVLNQYQSRSSGLRGESSLDS